MQIEVKIFSTLRSSVPGSDRPLLLTLEEETTMGELIELLKIPREKVKFLFVNSRHESPSYPLKDGDHVGIFPPSGGG
ncbi:MAG: MoaD/ThiS family protein [Deltaproteobacteria bacterium]|nr:MoaD/ThiS family protein [Deltaproteobacteria bacterium]